MSMKTEKALFWNILLLLTRRTFAIMESGAGISLTGFPNPNFATELPPIGGSSTEKKSTEMTTFSSPRPKTAHVHHSGSSIPMPYTVSEANEGMEHTTTYKGVDKTDNVSWFGS